VACVVDVDGVRQPVTPTEVYERIAAGRFFWIDIVGGDEQWRTSFLGQLGFDDADLAWAQRFGQTGRMVIRREKLRAVTWISVVFGTMTEIHLLGSPRCIATIWNGDAAALAEIREHFAERADKLEKSPSEAAAILLQLLLATLNSAVSELDNRMQALRTRIRLEPGSVDFSSLTERLQLLQSAWSDIDQYSSAVRSALIGIEALPGIDAPAAVELNDYAEQVEDLEHRLQERSRWGADILQDYATLIAKRQGEQISRLTIVSLIFLPITFLTGFFGMNFAWLSNALAGPLSFIILGVLLPALCAIATILWFRRRGVM
jgi:Mg2+ and Co2+ transporter CorA